MSKESKFLSRVLRHEPDLIGLTLGPGGWVVMARLRPPAMGWSGGIRHVHSDVVNDVPYVRRGHAGRDSGRGAASALGR